MKRECGACSLCCRVMSVPEVKQDHAWCRHAKPGHGCLIYKSRPEPCRSFQCLWLLGIALADHWYPKDAKIVVHTIHENDVDYIAFVVDPSYPNRWREEPWFSGIKEMAKVGIEGKLGKKWTTMVVIKDQKIPIIASERLLRAAG
jgi:hypothetical protein